LCAPVTLVKPESALLLYTCSTEVFILDEASNVYLCIIHECTSQSRYYGAWCWMPKSVSSHLAYGSVTTELSVWC